MEITCTVPITSESIDSACRAQCCFPTPELIRAGVAAALHHTPIKRLTVEKIVAEVFKLVAAHDAKFNA